MNKENEEQVNLKPARLGRALKKGLRDTWDYLGLVLVASAIFTLVALLPAFGTLVETINPTARPWPEIVGSVLAVILLPLVLTGIFRMAYKIVYRDDPGITNIASGFGELLLSGWLLALINILVIGVLVVDIAFFFGRIGPLKGSWFGYIIGALSIYALIIWLMMAMYQLPTLVAQRPRGQREGAIAAVKKSFLLVMGNPGFTTELFIAILGTSILCVLSVIGARISPVVAVFAVLSILVMLVLYAGTVSILLTHALRELFIRYGVVEDQPDVVVDAWER